ncbi:MAG: CHAP domain-containing protein [Acidimicrobiia bacterium]|nr:MAG: CHAP domain-containing protein [Acidimicrobiia bacterium]
MSATPVLAAARMLLPVREAQPNRGRFVEAIIRRAGGTPPEPWCASFVYYVGSGICGAAWPLPKTRSCDVLLEAARAAGALYGEEVRPESGWLFLVLASDTDATHVGFVDQMLPDGRFTTVEGNSNDRGHRDGDGVVANTRDPKGATRYAYIAWPQMMEGT